MLLQSSLFRVSLLILVLAGLVALNPFGRNLTDPVVTGSVEPAAFH